MTSQNATHADLFPLPLSDFEFYMLADDRPSHPMVFVILTRVRGELQETAFREALKELCASQPLLNCRVVRDGKPDWSWIPLPESDSHELLDWQSVHSDESARAFVPAVRSIDLTTSPGIRVEVHAGPDLATVVLHLHHVCSDGIGGLQILGELFARYGRKTAAPSAKIPDFEPCDPRALFLREKYDFGESAASRQRRSLRRTAGKISRLVFRKPAPLAASATLPRSASIQPAIRCRMISRPVHRALRAVAADSGGSINDLIIREMLIHIREWNRAQGRPFGRRWIRLGIPLSMRCSQHDRMPACNIVSYALVTRREQDCDDPVQLFTSVHQQTSDVLFNREGIVCLKLFKWLRRIPGAMYLFLHLKSCLSTLVLANVGDVRRRFHGRFPLLKGKWIAGNVVVEELHGVAPVRPNTRASVSIGDYAGQLSISLRTDASALSDHDSERFLGEFIDRLQSLAGPVPAAEPDNED